MRSYQIIIANNVSGLGDPIQVKLFDTEYNDIHEKLCACGVDIDGETVVRISNFLTNNKKHIPIVADTGKRSLEDVFKLLKEHCDRTYSTDEENRVLIPTKRFMNLAEDWGSTQSVLKKALKRYGILKPNDSEPYQYRYDKKDWYRIDMNRLGEILKEMGDFYA